jgi:hypothetical protein
MKNLKNTLTKKVQIKSKHIKKVIEAQWEHTKKKVILVTFLI